MTRIARCCSQFEIFAANVLLLGQLLRFYKMLLQCALSLNVLGNYVLLVMFLSVFSRFTLFINNIPASLFLSVCKF